MYINQYLKAVFKLNEQWFFLRRLLKYTSPILKMFEFKSIIEFEKNKEFYPVFIIGSPRSGTTLLYQLLSNYYKFQYVDNLVHLSREALNFGFWLSNLIYKDKPHNSFKSTFGNTTKDGLHAPNQTPVFWLKHRDLFVRPINDTGIFPQIVVDEIRCKVNYILNRYKKPIIMKGAVVGNNLNLFKHIFPNAKYILLQRNPLFIAHSLYKSLDHFDDFESAWMSHLKPNQKIENIENNIYKKISFYIYYLYANMVEGLRNISERHKTYIKYEDLSGNPEDKLIQIKDELKIDIDKRDNPKFPTIIIKKDQKMPKDEFKRLEQEIYALDWNKLGFNL